MDREEKVDACRFRARTGEPGRQRPVPERPVGQSERAAHGGAQKATEAAELLLDGEAEALTRRAVELALEGGPGAMRLCLERIIPPRRARPVKLGLPAVRGAADLAGTMAAITTAAGQGMITPGEAAELARVVEIFIRAVETCDFERRLRELEEAYAARP
jgi:hypothetical protein